MPKEGYKSITVSEKVYNRHLREYKKREDELRLRGINSFTGYITNILWRNLEVRQLIETGVTYTGRRDDLDGGFIK